LTKDLHISKIICNFAPQNEKESQLCYKSELKENWLRMEKGEEIINIKPLD